MEAMRPALETFVVESGGKLYARILNVFTVWERVTVNSWADAQTGTKPETLGSGGGDPT
jgi:hypothetical protein